MLRRHLFALIFLVNPLLSQTTNTTNLTTTPGNAQVLLNWTPPSTMLTAAFRIYRSTTPNVPLVTPLATLTAKQTFTDTEVSNGTTYYYRVMGSRPGGVTTYSNEASALPTGPAAPPPAPQTFTATAGLNQVSLAWSAIPGATSYSVFRSTVSNGQGTTPYASGVTALTFSDTQVNAANTYYYRVAGQSNAGLGTLSVEVAAKPNAPLQPPSAVGNLTATAGDALVTLAWGGAKGATSYNVYRSTNANAPNSSPLATNVLIVSYKDTTAQNGTTYFYRVAGVNADGVGPTSNVASATPTAPLQVPAAPTSLAVTAGNAKLTLSWTAPSNSTVSSYNIYRSTSPITNAVNPIATGVTQTTFESTNLTNGTLYYYRVAAVNAAGVGALSNSASGTPVAPLQVPAAPTGLTTQPGDTKVALSWTAPAGSTVTSYNIYRSTSAISSAVNPVATGVTGTTFQSAGLTNGTLYHFRVAAVNSAGVGALSDPTTATPVTAPQPPPAPTSLNAVSGDGKVTLSWTAPVGTVVTSYNIYRSTSPIAVAGTPIASNISTNSYVNDGLTNGTTYYFRVAAVNTVGPGPLSNEVFTSPEAPPPTSTTPTLLFAQLAAEGASQTGASGSATIQLAGDRNTAVLRYNFANLTTPITGKHLHGPASPGENGTIAFDIDTATPQKDGSYLWTIKDIASATKAQIVTALLSGRVYLNIHTVRNPAGEIRGHFRIVDSNTQFKQPADPPALPTGQPTASEASRLLTQATWGPTTAEIERVRSLGYESWIEDQFNKTSASYLQAVREYHGKFPDTNFRSNVAVQEMFWKQFLKGDDQLRSRVAMALSEIFVISLRDNSIGEDPQLAASWMDLLNANAFGNFRTLLEKVTLHPAMGLYLNMLNNSKEDPKAGRVPNENYAREILQLFTIGLWQVHPDASLKLDNTLQPIPTYDQDEILQFARIFTGWSWGGKAKTNANFYGCCRPGAPSMSSAEIASATGEIPLMEAWPQFHSTGIKTLLDGYVVADGKTPEEDLRLALDNIFQHGNVGPFISRQLIQRLVTSNPSPGYIYRVAKVFDNNGQGVRGDLRAVVKAILLDYEARSNNMLQNQGYGKQKEPIVRYGQLLRAFNASNVNNRYQITNLQSVSSLGQAPLYSPTVFNFFNPNYVQPGPMAEAGLFGPEFQITTESQVIAATNVLANAIYSGGLGSGDTRITLDMSTMQTAATNVNTLLDQLNALLLSGQMSSGLRTHITTALAKVTDPLTRVRRATHLIIASPEFNIQK